MEKIKKVFSKIEVNGGEMYLLTCVNDDKGGLNLCLCDQINAWRNSISQTELEELATSQVGRNREDYMKDTYEALTRSESDSSKYEYELETTDEGGRKFIWKRKAEFDIKVHLGSLVLNPVDDPSPIIGEIFEYSISKLNELTATVESVNEENERLARERIEALQRLDKCVKLKEEMENDLFSKFQIVVNDKKAKIRKLEKEVRDARYAASKFRRKETTESQAFRPQREDSVSDPEQQRMGDSTDEETDAAAAGSGNLQSRNPSTSTTLQPTFDSALFDEEDHQPLVIKKRRRQLQKDSAAHIQPGIVDPSNLTFKSSLSTAESTAAAKSIPPRSSRHKMRATAATAAAAAAAAGGGAIARVKVDPDNEDLIEDLQ